MEEFRPVLVDALVLALVNRRIFRPAEEREPAAFDFADSEPLREGYPILLTHQGLKKFVLYFERRLHQRLFFLPREQRLSFRDILLEQVRAFIRALTEQEPYQPFLWR